MMIDIQTLYPAGLLFHPVLLAILDFASCIESGRISRRHLPSVQSAVLAQLDAPLRAFLARLPICLSSFCFLPFANQHPE